MKRKAWIGTGCIALLAVISVWLFSLSSEKPADIETLPIVSPFSNSTASLVIVPDVTPSASLSPSPSVSPLTPVPKVTEAPVIESTTETDVTDTPVLQPDVEKKQVEVFITKAPSTSKPTAPPKPKPKKTDKPQSPDKPPSYEEKETTPNKDTAAKPEAGDKNNKGQIYIPGFGWVEDQGGGRQGTTVGEEGDELTGNKVGTMD
ncbi:DUF6550 family protein [Paenibacillus camerounensis]|uniref:DUF6550 family protein n=1 Tax=Paenibacillus camerounensis TaxID=1243663 RepID=UPI000693F7C9|nr:DUF6550 family protein [Paenibacillus camerounensis]